MGKHHLPMTRRSHSTSGLIRRPKRNVSTTKTYDDTVGLSRTEERELKKALYASLQESKRLYKYQQEDEKPPSSIAFRQRPMRSRSWPHTPLAGTPRVSTSMDESSQDSKSSVSSIADLKNKQERKIHAQRKFAQGSFPPTPNTTPVKVKSSPIKLLPKTAKTEDFLTFLCLRGSSVLPPHLDFFNFSRGEPPQGEISAPQTPPASDVSSHTKIIERTRESTPESSSVSTNDELYELGTPSPSSFIINVRNGLSARKAARASASTPETARGIVSLSQGLTKKASRVSTPHRGCKYGSTEKTPSPKKGSSLVKGHLSPSKRGFAVKSLSPQFSKSSPQKKLSLKQKSMLSYLPHKSSTKLGTSGKAGSRQLMLETEQVNNSTTVVAQPSAPRRSCRLLACRSRSPRSLSCPCSLDCSPSYPYSHHSPHKPIASRATNAKTNSRNATTTSVHFQLTQATKARTNSRNAATNSEHFQPKPALDRIVTKVMNDTGVGKKLSQFPDSKAFRRNRLHQMIAYLHGSSQKKSGDSEVTVEDRTRSTLGMDVQNNQTNSVSKPNFHGSNMTKKKSVRFKLDADVNDEREDEKENKNKILHQIPVGKGKEEMQTKQRKSSILASSDAMLVQDDPLKTKTCDIMCLQQQKPIAKNSYCERNACGDNPKTNGNILKRSYINENSSNLSKDPNGKLKRNPLFGPLIDLQSIEKPRLQLGGGVENIRGESEGESISAVLHRTNEVLNEDQVVPVGPKVEEFGSNKQRELIYCCELEDTKTNDMMEDASNVTEICFTENGGGECSITIVSSAKEGSSTEQNNTEVHSPRQTLGPVKRSPVSTDENEKSQGEISDQNSKMVEMNRKPHCETNAGNNVGNDKALFSSNNPYASVQKEQTSFNDYIQSLPPECVIDRPSRNVNASSSNLRSLAVETETQTDSLFMPSPLYGSFGNALQESDFQFMNITKREQDLLSDMSKTSDFSFDEPYPSFTEDSTLDQTHSHDLGGNLCENFDYDEGLDWKNVLFPALSPLDEFKESPWSQADTSNSSNNGLMQPKRFDKHDIYPEVVSTSAKSNCEDRQGPYVSNLGNHIPQRPMHSPNQMRSPESALPYKKRSPHASHQRLPESPRSSYEYTVMSDPRKVLCGNRRIVPEGRIANMPLYPWFPVSEPVQYFAWNGHNMLYSQPNTPNHPRPNTNYQTDSAWTSVNQSPSLSHSSYPCQNIPTVDPGVNQFIPFDVVLDRDKLKGTQIPSVAQDNRRMFDTYVHQNDSNQNPVKITQSHLEKRVKIPVAGSETRFETRNKPSPSIPQMSNIKKEVIEDSNVASHNCHRQIKHKKVTDSEIQEVDIIVKTGRSSKPFVIRVCESPEMPQQESQGYPCSTKREKFPCVTSPAKSYLKKASCIKDEEPPRLMPMANQPDKMPKRSLNRSMPILERHSHRRDHNIQQYNPQESKKVKPRSESVGAIRSPKIHHEIQQFVERRQRSLSEPRTINQHDLTPKSTPKPSKSCELALADVVEGLRRIKKIAKWERKGIFWKDNSLSKQIGMLQPKQHTVKVKEEVSDCSDHPTTKSANAGRRGPLSSLHVRFDTNARSSTGKRFNLASPSTDSKLQNNSNPDTKAQKDLTRKSQSLSTPSPSQKNQAASQVKFTKMTKECSPPSLSRQTQSSRSQIVFPPRPGNKWDNGCQTDSEVDEPDRSKDMPESNLDQPLLERDQMSQPCPLKSQSRVLKQLDSQIQILSPVSSLVEEPSRVASYSKEPSRVTSPISLSTASKNQQGGSSQTTQKVLFPPPPTVMSCGVCEGGQPYSQSFKPVKSQGSKKSDATKRLKAKLQKQKELLKQKLSNKVKKKALIKSKMKMKSDKKKQTGAFEEHPKKKRIVRRSSSRLKELTKAMKVQRKRRHREVDPEEEVVARQPTAKTVAKRRFAPRPIGGLVAEMPRAVTEEYDFDIFSDDTDDEISFGNVSFRQSFSVKKTGKETLKKKRLKKSGVNTRSANQSSFLSSPAKIVATKCRTAVKKLRASKSEHGKLTKIIEKRRKKRQQERDGESKRGRKPSGSKKPGTPEKGKKSDTTMKLDVSSLQEVPTFHPTEEEFRDPILYIESIREKAEPYGMCQIIPPSSWKCESKINEEMRFTAQVQHIHQLYNRWGPNAQFTACVNKHLNSTGANLESSPHIGGVEVDLCKLSQTIQENGGMQNNMDKKKWMKTADTMKIPKMAQDRGMRLYDVYCKHLLPYETLSSEEKSRVEQSVLAERQKLLKSGKNDEDDAIVKGKSNPLSAFIRVARNISSMWFKDEPTPEQVELEYWKLLEERKSHVAVQCGHVSTSTQGSGFPSKKDSPYSKHGWNLNNLSENPKCILRCLGPISGATIPTLHIGMMFATSCWCTDIHHLPYIQYLHTGADIIWYSVPKQQESKLKSVMKDLVPTLVSGDPRWVKEDTVMVNPARLSEKGVTVSRCVQRPKTFVAIFPKSYTATISCGYNVSESTHYATRNWISTGVAVAEDLNKSVEPELFSMDALLCHLVSDPTTDLQTLKTAVPFFEKALSRELSHRKQLVEGGLKPPKRCGMSDDPPSPPSRKRSIDQVDDNICDQSKKNCFLSKVVNDSENVTLSLEEGLKHIQKKKNLKNCKLFYRYTEDELKSLLQSAQCRLELSGNMDTPGKKRGGKK